MSTYIHPHSKKAGLPPGSYVHVGVKKSEQITIQVFSYNAVGITEQTYSKAGDALNAVDRAYVNWINVSGLAQTEVIREIGEHFGLHPLTIEDVLNTGQRPRIEDHEGYLFITLKMLYPDKSGRKIIYEQVSLIMTDCCVITFQESARDVFDPIRERIRMAKGRIRGQGADYLAYCLIDAIVDNYYVVLEKMGEHIELIEDRVTDSRSGDLLRDIHDIKREMLFLRRSIWPLRDVIGFLARGDSSLISDGTAIYFRDVYDHTIQVVDTTELFRDMISGMLDTYLTSLSNRMNEVMKVLTVFASIFIPLTFIVGIYGMNFEYMPELGWHWAYPALWVVMSVVVISMALYFRKKRWI